MFHVEMHNIIAKQAAPLSLYDKIISLMNSYHQSDQILNKQLMSSWVLQKHLGCVYNPSIPLKPLHWIFSLIHGRKVTVPNFDVENMILSMVMNAKMITSMLLVTTFFTGKKIPSPSHNMKYGEVHTSKACDTALTHYCGDDSKLMPLSFLAKISFGTDLHTRMMCLVSFASWEFP